MGELQGKRARNPLNAEKSPRLDFHGFDVNPPPGREEKDRWVYPESDWGLMAKFQSQKPIYEAIYHRERSQKQVDQEIQRLREKNQRMIEDEIRKREEHLEHEKFLRQQKDAEFKKLGDMLANPGKYSHIQLQRQQQIVEYSKNGGADDNDHYLTDAIQKELNGDNHHHHRGRKNSKHSDNSTPRVPYKPLDMNTNALFNKFGKSSVNQEMLDRYLHENNQASTKPITDQKQLQKTMKKTKRNLDLYEKNLLNTYSSLSEIPVSNMRPLQKDHPEILAKYRADRAAEFVSKHDQVVALHSPPAAVGTLPFRPGNHFFLLVFIFVC
jgi:hypothetical protein